MFNKKEEGISLEFHNSKVTGYEEKIRQIQLDYKLQFQQNNFDHEMQLKQKDFDLKHFKDEEVKKLRSEMNTLKEDNAVIKKENEMLAKITDLNADVIDVKKLVSDLINKLPEVKISSLAVTSHESKK